MIPQSSSLRIILIAWIMGAAAACLADDAVPVPPPPERPPWAQGLSPAQNREALQKWRAWRADLQAWRDGLTPAQKAELQRRQAAEAKIEWEKIERLQRLPLPSDGYRWQDEAARRQLSADVVARLERDKLAYGKPVQQIFVPYDRGPVFVTSDSVLNAYQVLFEETFRELERRRARVLRGRLEEALDAFRSLAGDNIFPAERFGPAWRHVQRVLGPAVLLLGGTADSFDPQVRPDISDAASRIARADSVALPGWLAPADPATLLSIDFRRCRPVGIYAGDPGLENYFRAVRWLQMVPLRASRDPELLSAVLLGMAISDRKLGGFFDQLSRFVGPPDDPSPLAAWEAYPSRSSPQAQFSDIDSPFTRDRWAQRLRSYYLVNSDLRASDRQPADFSQLTFRVVPAFALPDAALFQRLDDRGSAPTGLEIAAWLGSDFAVRHLDDAQRRALASVGPEVPLAGLKAAPTLSRFYYAALRQLFSPAPPNAPAFLGGEAWQAKSCETALGGWVQLRHGYTLQAKLSVATFGVVLRPPGFIEPNAGFYAAMARLVDRAHDAFADGGIFAAGPPERASLEDRWRRLRDMLSTLEPLADKQIAERDFTPDEADFLRGYGEKLGAIMGYSDDGTDFPKDDAPKWAEVNLDPNSGQSLAVGLGRPRTLYVLYPWKGMEVLCAGGVTTYYEYPSRDRLTDPEWRALLDSKEAPVPPAWAP
ncbi:MAG TPA: DUF3160 domain-containing protein [Opitutaceae bacterium]|nr:DUF3160 domain-containing protein [Opitutaceae bacterium]